MTLTKEQWGAILKEISGLASAVSRPSVTRDELVAAAQRSVDAVKAGLRNGADDPIPTDEDLHAAALAAEAPFDEVIGRDSEPPATGG